MAPPNKPEQNFTIPGLSFLCVKHDHDCPARLNQDIDDCICNELEYEFHSSPERFTASAESGRAARREAARKAAKASRKANRK